VVFLYLGTVMRFVMLEAVVNGRVRLGQSFGRWQAVANSLFVWRLVFTLIVGGVSLLLISGPLYLAWRAGFPAGVVRAMLPMIVLVVLFLLVVGIVASLVWLLVKDFAVPMMALEGLTASEACMRLVAMVRADPGAYAGYVGMKIVLAMAAGLVIGIAAFILILLLVVPAVLLAAVAGAFGAGTVAGHALAITIAIVVVVVAVVALLVISAAWGVAAVVFFQAYVLQFFAGRYGRLAAVLFPEPLPPPAPAPQT
jgi:hypothetical protein